MSAATQERHIVTRLRTLVPRRNLTSVEARSLAERQATRLLAYAEITEPPVPQFVISALPRITVDRQPDWPTSGMSTLTREGWRIVLCADEALVRQRFSLAHEFKHVLDDPFIDRLYAHLPEEARAEHAERIANTFAACLLMPRTWLKRDWCHGMQTLAQLARRYAVSREAMAIRLAELDLYYPIGKAQ